MSINVRIKNNSKHESRRVLFFLYFFSADAESGDYEVQVSVSYNSGYDTLEESTSVSVKALELAETEEDSIVTVVVDEAEPSEDEKTDFSTALRLGFGILAVLIVILALILIVRR